MFVIWLFILLGYGFTGGWSEIPPLAWLLLIPLLCQDSYDVQKHPPKR